MAGPSGSELLLGIDGGQTATKAVLADRDGRVLATGRGGPAEHLHAAGGEAKNREAIHGAIGAALAAAEAAPEGIAAVAIGWTGAVAGRLQVPLLERIAREVLRPRRVVVVPDYETNLAGASLGEPGVVVIAGGGAIAYGVTAEGREAISGGFGYLLGDEGSAFDVGRRAIVAAARASDGRGPATALERGVAAAFGIATMGEVTRIVYAAGFSRERISALAPLVTAAALGGDAVATEIVRTAGEELAASAVAVLRRLAPPDDGVPVFPTGGVFAAGEVILAPFAAALRRGWAGAIVRQPAHPPSVGALLLAARAAGIEPDARWWANVAAGPAA